MTDAYINKATTIQNYISRHPTDSANSVISHFKGTRFGISRKVGLKLVKHSQEAIKLKNDLLKYGFKEDTTDRIYKFTRIRAIKEAKRNKTTEESSDLRSYRSIKQLRESFFPDPEHMEENKAGT